ncbi:MAG: hypothetical protein ACKPGB_02190, partial [Dolichospermum sp.]
WYKYIKIAVTTQFTKFSNCHVKFYLFPHSRDTTFVSSDLLFHSLDYDYYGVFEFMDSYKGDC